MKISKKFTVILVLFAIATAVGIYDNFVRRPQAKYYTPETVSAHTHSIKI